jgi:hypothetical protein
MPSDARTQDVQKVAMEKKVAQSTLAKLLE